MQTHMQGMIFLSLKLLFSPLFHAEHNLDLKEMELKLCLPVGALSEVNSLF